MYEPIAIVGTACRFPGAASSPSKLWDLLRAPRDVAKEFPSDRLNAASFYHENGEVHGRTNVHHKSYLLEEDIRHFDSGFFRINPKEAADMDPQQRILLETVYEAFEAAGWSIHDINGSQTSVHVGVMTEDYTYIQSRDPDTMGSHATTGVSRAILSNRVSHAFNLQGPSLTVDTACSSSLVALHLAAQGLHRKEATHAVVAGTSLLMDTMWYILESSMHMLSTDSQSRMWDKSANGYARGEGCAAIVIKTLSQAIRDGDHIECVIRGTGVNSDGRTNGITVPSPTAQAALIRQTYRDAGLDPLADRCQYFECHGTGTQAGDPVEAQAIKDAFFPDDENRGDSVLYCGSIKTIIGHLEGCAGLAGVIKASLALQNKEIPPNMHFHELNPKVEPFYKHLEVPTSLLPWPQAPGGVRRASVNSFGFGGTNAHAIIESYDPSDSSGLSPHSSLIDVVDESSCKPSLEGRLVGPFVFSAKSRGSLAAWLKQFLDHVRQESILDLDSVSHSLHSKRSVFPYRCAIPAVLDQDDLIQKLEDQINILSTSTEATPKLDPRAAVVDSAKIMGIFTGQGAQAARMGYGLLQHCNLFKDAIMECEEALASIPHPPNWSLIGELAADPMVSRVSEAKYSQPLCTAIQIGLVDLLHACGIKFSAVVGHSSGEIGAAYAAGLLSKKDAMGISYYRGYVAHLAQGAGDKAGGMMAATMSFDAAAAICSQPPFEGRINVAASNSPTSVTLSGDKDALVEMKVHLNGRNIQAKALQVDTAYHSHHMLACADAYLEHLKQLDVHVLKPRTDQTCCWYSSVRAGTNMLDNPAESGLEAHYWLENMVRPVLFSEAIEVAVKADGTKFSVAMEVGPHPALKGPVNQTLKAIIDYSPSYTGCLARGKDGIDTFSDMLATIWTIAPGSIDFAGWRRAFGLMTHLQPVKNLPPYAWDHTQIHWRESRVVHNYRLGRQLPSDLLGRLWNDSQYEHTWRNIFKLNEMPWVKGHAFQEQVLFPATGYISMALDASKALVKDRPIKFIEVKDMVIPTALVIGEGDEIEILFTIRSRELPQKAQDDSIIQAEFYCYAYPDQRTADRTCHGRLMIHLGELEAGDLAPVRISDTELTPFNTDRFYRAVSDIGFAYQGPFRALTSINKCWGHAKATASWSEEDLRIDSTLHPAILDTALQAGISTFVSTAENSMVSSYLPVGVKRVVISPNICLQSPDGSTDIEIEAYMTGPTQGQSREIDINVRTNIESLGNLCEVQLEGVSFQAISEPQPSDDRNILAKTVWGLDVGYGLVGPGIKVQEKPPVFTPEEYERIALFYMQSLGRSVDADRLAQLKPHHQELIGYIHSVVQGIEAADHPVWSKDWLNDDSEVISNLESRDPADVDMILLKSSGEKTLALLSQNAESDDSFFEGLAGSFHQKSSLVYTCNQYMAQLAHQITHKFPRSNILQISGAVSSAASVILDAIGDAYDSYTCSGSSEAIVEGLRDAPVPADSSKLNFKVFDVLTDATSQGMKAGSYDVIIAIDVLRASHNLSDTIQNIRDLLRPGGFLIAMELTGSSLQSTAIMGGLEGWWSGVQARGAVHPSISTGEWDRLLYRNGFSGLDCAFEDQPETSTHGFSVFSAQATDDRLDVLRDPLSSIHMIAPTPVILIGGDTCQVSMLSRSVERMLRNWASDVQIYNCFDMVDWTQIRPGSSVISLQDLDRPLFSSPPSENELQNLKMVLEAAQNMLWVTSGRLMDDPYANIMIGIGRSLRLEFPDINLHFLDFDEKEGWDAQVLLRQFLRLIFASSLDKTQEILWADEPEVVIKDSNMMVARVVPDQVSNEVYNANRRRLFRLVDPTVPIEIAREPSSSQSILACSRPMEYVEGHVPVQVSLSIDMHGDGGASCFLCYGRMKNGSEKSVMTLSKTSSSIVTAPEGSASILEDCDAEALASVAKLLVASQVICGMATHGISLVCGADEDLVNMISKMAQESGRRVSFICISKNFQSERPGWVYIHPNSSVRVIQRTLPPDSTTLYSLSKKEANFLRPCLPEGCTVQTFDADTLTQNAVEEAAKVYQSCRGSWSLVSKPTIVSVPAIVENKTSDLGHFSVVTDWTRHGSVSAIVRGLEPRSLLSPNKTYLLVGMASELGQSLTYFMVRGGARHIVLSSRNPKQNQRWVHNLRETGINLHLVKMDVTDRSQVRETVSELRRTMPEIGGVANAALVLEPGVFTNLSAESISKQLKPKVYGAAHLDDEFKTVKLDFFLAFGSLLTVVGNAGQAIYHAGNTFMMSLVNQRRRRGLAASILNFGMLVDVGYVARSDRAGGSNVEDWLRSHVSTALSEEDFHHVILQGIAQGHPESASGEVIMGLEIYHDKGKGPRPRWTETALFSHMVRAHKVSGDEKPDNAPSPAQRWQKALENAGTVDEAIPPITELLSRKIESMIHLSLHSIHPDEPLSNLGIDSINAIEIRKWLREKLNVDVSMLKILGRDSSLSIIRTVAGQYLAKQPTHKNAHQNNEFDAKAPLVTKEQTVETKLNDKKRLEVLTESSNTPDLHEVNSSPISSTSTSPKSGVMTPQSELKEELIRSERLSYAQAGFYYLNTLSESRTSWNVTAKYRINGALSVNRFIDAFDKVTRRWDALNTRFFATSGTSEVLQHVINNNKSRLTYLQSSQNTVETNVDKAFDEIAAHEYSLATGDTFRATLISHHAQNHTLILGFHNIAFDVASVGYIFADIDRAYRLKSFSESPTSYLDFCRQKRDDIVSGKFDKSIDYWKSVLDPIPETLPLLPFAKVKSRQNRRAYGHHLMEREISGQLVQRVTEISQAHGVTLMQFYLAAIQVFLCRLLDIDDVCIGIIYMGRDSTSKYSKTVGHAANILPIRFKGGLSKSFPEILQNTSDTVLSSLDHADVPFALILEKIQAARSDGDLPLIQVAYDYRVHDGAMTEVGGCSVVTEETKYTTLYDLTIDVVQSTSQCHVINIRCSDDFYSPSTTEFIAETYISVLESLISDPSAFVKNVTLFSDTQLQQALTAAHGPDIQHQWPTSLAERFEQVSANFPDSIAVKDGGEAVTYRQLRQKMGLFAKVLLDADLKPGSRVAVLCKPSTDLYATMLAIYYIGAVFVPLDLSVPATRRNDMMKACMPALLVFHAATSEVAATEHGHIKSLDISKKARAYPQNAPVPQRTPSDPGSDSHILFTSGSTGVPKGIRLHQRGVMNYASYTSKAYGFGQIKVLQQTSIGFDMAFAQIYNAFTNGGTLVVAPIEARGDPEVLSRLILNEKIEFTFCTPSEYVLLFAYARETLERCYSWRYAHTGGEALPEHLIYSVRNLGLPNLMLINAYGPAEALIVTDRDVLQETNDIHGHQNDFRSIGRALSNTSIYITSEVDGRLLPLGMPGEICIGGACVANGYLDSNLSREKFVHNPFATAKYIDQGFNIMYKSGDRGILQADGAIIFLGRAHAGNAVVKLRGLRIDLNEVSGEILRQAPEHLSDAAVTMRGDPAFLVSHVVFKSGKHLEHRQLTTLMQQLNLPRYMIPSAIVPLDRLPATTNGKLDTAALERLPLPAASGQQKDQQELTETEMKLRDIWIDIVGAVAETTEIGPDSSFFTLGGNSFLLVHLQHRMSNNIGIRIPLSYLTENHTLRDMALIMKKSDTS